MLEIPKKVKKPWGAESWNLTDKFCFKQIHINKGFRTSLQYHNEKLELIHMVKGRAIIELGDDPKNLKQQKMKKGDVIIIQPGTIHRTNAITDIDFYEVSTPEVHDVFRIEDDTNRPDGKIEEEHA